jgi:hypothetical protein
MTGPGSRPIALALRDPSVLARALVVVAAGALLLHWLFIPVPVSSSQTVLRFYRAQPGFEGQFTTLFRKNTYRLLEAQLAAGDIEALQLFMPSTVADGNINWTLFVSIQYVARDGAPPAASDALIQDVFGQRATYDLEKIAEAKLLDAQWDVRMGRLP